MSAAANPSLEILEKLCNAHGVSGYEDDVREIIRDRLEPLAAETKVDALGNLILTFPAEDTAAPTLMLDAHMDEIGLVVNYIEPNGFLRFTTVARWDERVLPAHRVAVRTQGGKLVTGVLGTPPPHILKPEERTRPFAIENMFIDIGAGNASEVSAMGVAVGDSAVPYYPFERLHENAVMGKALDNRAGCTVLIRTLESIFGKGSARPRMNVAAVFSTFEEVGGRGAQAAAHRINPDLAMVFEGTVAADFPGVSPGRMPSRQGQGPALTLIDQSAHVPRRLVTFVQELADAKGLPHQYKTPSFGGTNAGTIHTSQSGIATAVMSVPCRYIHSANATLRPDDLENTIELAIEFVLQAHRFMV